MDDHEIKNAVELLELILLAKLVRFTGIVWDVHSDISKWHFIFHCRYGAGRYDVVDTQCFDARNIEELIESRMDEATTSLIQHYLKKSNRKGE